MRWLRNWGRQVQFLNAEKEVLKKYEGPFLALPCLGQDLLTLGGRHYFKGSWANTKVSTFKMNDFNDLGPLLFNCVILGKCLDFSELNFLL